MPFLVYSIVMLAVVPFGAKLIPSKPLEDKKSTVSEEKNSDERNFGIEDLEEGETTTNDDDNVFEAGNQPKKRINPFKLVWSLLKNKVCYKIIINMFRIFNDLN